MKVTIVEGVREAREAAGDAPFRAPHHSVHDEGLVGEIALATGGVLFLDELDAFDPYTLRKGFALLRSMRAMGHPHTPRVFATVGGSHVGGVLGVLAGFNTKITRGRREA